MRRIGLIVGSVAFLLYACSGVATPHDVTIKSTKLSEDTVSYTFNASVPHVYGLNDETAQHAINAQLDSVVTRYKRDFLRDVRALSTESGSTTKSGLTITYDALSLSQDLVSIVFVLSPYMSGAAHPNHFTVSYNYDVHSRREIGLSDLFSSGAYLTRISHLSEQKLIDQSQQNGTYYEGKENIIHEGTLPDPQNFRSFNIVNGTLTLNFDPYQVGPYAEGILHVTILRGQVEPMLSEMGRRLLVN